MPRGSRNWEWMVTPPAFNAAIPVGATTAKGLCVFSVSWRRKVVLPVPAFPVRKMLADVLLMNFTVNPGKSSSCSPVGVCCIFFRLYSGIVAFTREPLYSIWQVCQKMYTDQLVY